MTDTPKLKIDETLAALLPPLSTEETEALETDLRETGMLQPILACASDYVILDGHNRWAICQRLFEEGLNPWKDLTNPVLYLDIEDLDQRIEIALSSNANRRHLTKEQKRYQVEQLRKRGWDFRRIARAVGVSKSTVDNWLKDVSNFGHVSVDRIVDTLGRMQPAHKSKKKRVEEPDLEYLSETASQDMSLEALQMAWADFQVVNGFTDEEFKAALENPTSFHEYLDQMRKQYNRTDVAEAAAEILGRLYSTNSSYLATLPDSTDDLEARAEKQKRSLENRLQQLIEDWCEENEIGLDLLVIQPDELEARERLDYRMRLTCELARTWDLIPAETLGLILSGALYHDLPRWIEQRESASEDTLAILAPKDVSNFGHVSVDRISEIPKGPPLEVWQLEALIPHALEDSFAKSLEILMASKSKTGPAWTALEKLLADEGYKFKKTDLKQAVANLLDHIQQQKRIPQPA